jgi:glycosyltransferase involved in cell wall biosynthesis
MKKRVFFYAHVENLDLFTYTGFYQIDVQILKNLGYDVYTTNSILDFLKFYKYEITFIYFWTWGLFPAILSKLFGKKVYFTGGIDSLDKELNNSKINYNKHKFFFKLCTIFSDGNIIVSESDINNIKKTGFKINNSWLVPHVIDFEKYKYCNEIKEDIFTTISWMGTEGNVVRKGVDKLICIFNELSKTNPTYILIIIGTKGPGSEYLENIVKKFNLSDKIVFTGALSEIEKISYLKRSKMYFQLSKYEGFGLAPIEAMAAGNVIIHSGNGGLNYTIRNLGFKLDINKSNHQLSVEVNEIIDNMTSPKIVEIGIEHIKNNYSYEIRLNKINKIINNSFNG